MTLARPGPFSSSANTERRCSAKADSPASRLSALTKIAGLFPTHTRRSAESEAFQQFSTPTPLGFAALTAAAIGPADRVLEPSAGTGLLAILAEIAGGALVLNELAETRSALLTSALSGRSRHALRRRADRRPPRSSPRAERRVDEPALLGDGECRRPRGRHRLSPHRLGARASRRRRAAGGDHRRKLRAGHPGLARRLRPAAGARSHRVHRRDRRRRSTPSTAPPSTRG